MQRQMHGRGGFVEHTVILCTQVHVHYSFSTRHTQVHNCTMKELLELVISQGIEQRKAKQLQPLNGKYYSVNSFRFTLCLSILPKRMSA